MTWTDGTGNWPILRAAVQIIAVLGGLWVLNVARVVAGQVLYLRRLTGEWCTA
jgi:hypothetical protein